MKKLMMFAAAMTIVGSAFAEVAAYDYKASVKNVDLKEAKVKADGYSFQIVIKYVRSTSLYGYLVNPCDYCDDIQDNGYGFLVLANKADKGKVPYIMAAGLEVKVWDPKFKTDFDSVVFSKTWQAEGYLWAWGSDYSTEGLFLGYNQASGDVFYDAWMDASGFGTALYGETSSNCGEGSICIGLETLSGSVIGGMFLCHANGYPVVSAETFLCDGWYGQTDVITGTWSIKRNTKLVGLALTADEELVTLGNSDIDEMVKAAIKAINSNYGYLDVVSPAFASNQGVGSL